MKYTIFSICLILAGCGTKPLAIAPSIGYEYGADKIKCTYERNLTKYKTVCTFEDEGEVK